MRGTEINKLLQVLAPFSLAYEGEELGFIWGNPEKEVHRLGVTWRPTAQVLRECLQLGIDMLIIHEPLFQSRRSTVIPDSQLTYPPNQLRKSLLEQRALCVYRAHSNWDDSDKGNNVVLARELGLKIVDTIPYGRVCTCAQTNLGSFVEHVKSKLGCAHVLVVGDVSRRIERVVVVSGSGNSLTEMIEMSKQRKADVLVSGDIQDSRARFATELDIALIDAGGYYTETPGMKHFANLLRSQLPGIDVYYLDPGPPWHIE
jgi:dinuclear metal center YbgI/SA1388 family protein